MEDGEELKAFIKLWYIAISSICYCYFIPSRIIHGLPRFLSLLPIITLFFILPLPISTVHLSLPTFFFLVFLGNLKLLLFALNRGPLSASTPQLPILAFIAVALLPINPKQSNKKTGSSHKPILLAIKAVILAFIVDAYQYKDEINWYVILLLYFCHFYFSMELGFAIAALFVKMFLGFEFEIEPQFNEPYLATSLQDFWGRRWNRMASGILRATVYNPVRAISTPALGKLPGRMMAIFATFVVSGVLHELMFMYMMRVPPTWEVSWLFVLHGACTAVEVALKEKVNGKFRLHWVLSWPLTLAFVLVTCSWLFFAQPLRNGLDAKMINESSILLKLFRSKLSKM